MIFRRFVPKEGVWYVSRFFYPPPNDILFRDTIFLRRGALGDDRSAGARVVRDDGELIRLKTKRTKTVMIAPYRPAHDSIDPAPKTLTLPVMEVRHFAL